MKFHQFAYGSDNYGVLVHDETSGQTALVDAGDAGAALAALKETGWTLSHIWITHHHWDHTDGLAEVKAATGAEVIGPHQVSQPIDGLDREMGEGDVFAFGGTDVRVLHTPGHTTDMINFYLPDVGVVFTGDTLFTLGCGRIFEGNPAMMWESLSKLADLPAETIVYSAHEYTLANAKFAASVDADNPDLVAQISAVKAKRERGEATSPSTIGMERATNPFLRAADPAIRACLGMETASDAEVFAEIRKRKDNF
ncbi:MAG: hydroxyacylglutathione hydrolase [Pikeienuella sp.]